MQSFDDVLRQLRQEHKQAQSELEKLDKAISAIEVLNGRNAGTAINGTRPKRTMSASARRRIATAQKARWAKMRQASPHADTKRPSTGRGRISAEGRKRIAAAARARWARVKAQQAKKAA